MHTPLEAEYMVMEFFSLIHVINDLMATLSKTENWTQD